MHEIVTTPRAPNPIDTFKGAPRVPVARWREMKSRRKREMERFGDLQRHPWRGERQAGKSRGIYANNVRTVDRELALVPYGERLRNPPSGAYPLVQGLELGTGPHPWIGGRTDEAFVRRAVGTMHPGGGKAMPVERNLPVDPDYGAYWDGPYAPVGLGLPLAKAEGSAKFGQAASRKALGIASGALTGGQLGSLVPGVGSAFGAAAGGVLGYVAS